MADGERLGTVLLVPATVQGPVTRRRFRQQGLESSVRARAGSLRDLLASGLLHDFCELAGRRAAERTCADRRTTYHRGSARRDLFASGLRSRRIVGHIVQRTLGRNLPPCRRALELHIRVATLEDDVPREPERSQTSPGTALPRRHRLRRSRSSPRDQQPEPT